MDDEPPNPKLISKLNDYYEDLLGYSVKDTELKSLNKKQWDFFCNRYKLDENSLGIYLPRNQTAIIPEDNKLSLFHEYFGHGLYCEQSLIGKKLIDLERKLLEEEKDEFQNENFTIDELNNFRSNNKTYLDLRRLKETNLDKYEGFAIFSEYLLSKEFNLMNSFEKKYNSFMKQNEGIESIISFNKKFGDLATFYEFGLARRTTTERVKKLLEDVYNKETIDNSKLILLTGSKKPFSDIDLFASSNYLQSTKNNWLDLVSFNEKDFERRIRLFEIQVTHPIMKGEFIAGDKNYLEQKRKQLQEQQITEEAIQHNLKKFREQKIRAYQYPKNSEERQIGLSYSQTYLENALALKERKRFFTKEDLIRYSQSEKFIELKGGLIG